METGALIIGAIVGYFICRRMGWTRTINDEHATYRHYKNKEIVSIKDVIDIVIEQEDDWLYVYNFHTNEFMAQGKTKTDLETALIHRYPTKLFNASEENIEAIGL